MKSATFANLETFYITFATTEVLAEKIQQSLSTANISTTRLLSLSRDGPPANNAIFNRLNADNPLSANEKCYKKDGLLV